MHDDATRILVVGQPTGDLYDLCGALRERGYVVLQAASYPYALAVTGSYAPGLVLLDADLPGELNGCACCHLLRQAGVVPIVALSRQVAVPFKVDMLDQGADDFVTRPYCLEELLARMRACLRRAGAGRGSPSERDRVLFSYDRRLRMDAARREVRLGERLVPLTPTEFRLLQLFLLHQGKVLTHRFLLQEVWGSGYGSETNYVRIYVRHLRAKLDEPTTAPYILNQPGVGYLLRDGSLPPARLESGERQATPASTRAGTALSA